MPSQVSRSGADEDITVSVGTNILSTNVQPIRERVLELLGQIEQENPEWSRLRLDLTAAQMIDSSGLNFLVSVVRHLKKRGIALRILVSSANIQKSFSFIRLDRQADVVLVSA